MAVVSIFHMSDEQSTTAHGLWAQLYTPFSIFFIHLKYWGLLARQRGERQDCTNPGVVHAPRQEAQHQRVYQAALWHFCICQCWLNSDGTSIPLIMPSMGHNLSQGPFIAKLSMMWSLCWCIRHKKPGQKNMTPTQTYTIVSTFNWSQHGAFKIPE